MAPTRKTPRKARGPGDYTNVGKIGRRTGVELKDTGVRDENGIEPIPSFSSPEKLQTNGIPHESTYTADDSMDIGQSTVAEPLEVVRTARNARLSVPRSISPRKTWINGSPRRSVGPISSPSKNPANGTPSRSSSHQPVNRHLDFSMDDPSLITRQSPQMPPPTLNKSAKTASAGKKGKNKRVFDLNVEEDDGDEETNGASIINGSFNDTYALPTGDDEPLGDSIIGLENGDDHIEPSIEEDQTQLEGSESIIAEPETTRGAKAKSRKSSGRTAQAPMDNPDESQVSIPTSTTRRGRPPKKQKTQALQDHVAEQASGPSKTMKGKRKPPIPARKPIGKASSVRAGSTGPRPNIVQRSETPATDSGALVTRSGRHSFKPLASWRGEKAIFGQRPDAETLPGIADIIRTEEIMPPPPRRRPTNKSGRPRQRGTQLEDLEEEDEELDPWETEMGIMHAQIMTWNQDTGKYDEDDIEEHEIAYAADAIEMRDIAGADFKFAKTLTLPFFGSGMVHLPPKGVKRVKNSRKMQMVFFVFYGRVTVDVGTPTTSFSIGKGGQWQVPRGNFYSISNESETRDARIFFAQGCEITGDENAAT